ncbi:Stp1/IreP family PP2C-type Ser/Thr phosphatase [Bradymonas sediminis]|uniref:Stp1/IreP family PP2C-type Ser/Thr phosphatase n=1 Tax=Bradymonas sediminis TaxID=1548548 RepID=A0A2Z4FH47_9DELT|nr:Stp1/IreP family PP2C-type Ser/Thr phosphatase [Bradymonas sediminis]AWV88312.1 Stp1/IreP family PP2C-type Ser/Thr phosphatase [Bradymonas sediminis]TDP77437.1 protein phosphatase [Bradymonas sediminis]
MKLICAGMTDVGSTRDHNEDDFYLSDGKEALCVVADGMGGHRSGEVASAMAIKAMVEYYRETMSDEASAPDPPVGEDGEEVDLIEYRLREAVLSANTAVFTAASESEMYQGMGTTIVLGYFTNDGAYFANIGDSRAYRFRDGKLEQRTEDHSLANEYVRMGILAAEDIEYFPYKNVITRACGLADEVEVDVHFEEMQVDDIFLFCSDGLSDMIRDGQIEQLFKEEDDLEKLCRRLIDVANENGGEDNITVILAKVTE